MRSQRKYPSRSHFLIGETTRALVHVLVAFVRELDLVLSCGFKLSVLTNDHEYIAKPLQ